MYKYSKKSEFNLSQCYIDLQLIFKKLLHFYDHSVICGYRNEEDQNEAFTTGNSQLKYPKSNHNKIPSLAVDVVPYPLDWGDLKRFYEMAGMVKAITYLLNKDGLIKYNIEWGGDWKSFKDYSHFQLDE